MGESQMGHDVTHLTILTTPAAASFDDACTSGGPAPPLKHSPGMHVTDGQDDGAGQPAIEVDGGVVSADLVWRNGEKEEDGGEGPANQEFDKGQYSIVDVLISFP